MLWLVYGLPVLGWVDTQGDPDKLLGLWKGDTFSCSFAALPILRWAVPLSTVIIAGPRRFLGKTGCRRSCWWSCWALYPEERLLCGAGFPLLVISLSGDNGWFSKLLCLTAAEAGRCFVFALSGVSGCYGVGRAL